MSVIAFTMKIHPDKAEEYKRRHDQIWPELTRLLDEHGIYDYSIHLDVNASTLFAVHKVKPRNKLAELPKHPLMQKWWAYMSDIMETNEDNSPKINDLYPVFLLSTE